MSTGNLFLGGALCVALLSGTIAAQETQPGTTTASRFPPGPGRDALFKVCKECHGPESVLGQLKTRSEWSKTLDEMAANGATGTDEEWNSILEYLDTHYSLILVNTAPATELEGGNEHPELAGWVERLLEPPEPGWADAAEHFWSAVSEMRGAPEGLAMHRVLLISPGAELREWTRSVWATPDLLFDLAAGSADTVAIVPVPTRVRVT